MVSAAVLINNGAGLNAQWQGSNIKQYPRYMNLRVVASNGTVILNSSQCFDQSKMTKFLHVQYVIKNNGKISDDKLLSNDKMLLTTK